MINFDHRQNEKKVHETEDGDRVLPPLDDSWWGIQFYQKKRILILVIIQIQFRTILKIARPITGRSGINSDKTDWEVASHLFQQDQLTRLKVTGFNRGGLLVEGENLQGFVPLSHLLDIRCEGNDVEKHLTTYVDRILMLKVIECDQINRRIVFSERAALSEPGTRIQLLNNLQEGDCVRGAVTNITDFGVFVDLGGIEGLVHVSEISWGRVQHPDEVVSLGQNVDAFVIQVDQERSRIALKFKRLKPNPWETVRDRYHPGQRTEATVTSIVPYGVFARLEEGLDGLIHISEMGCGDSSTASPDKVVEKGQRIQVRILHVDIDKQRLGLSLLSDD